MSSPTPLKFLMPGWFSVVMGLAGLALAWHSAEAAMGEAAVGVALVLGGLALVVFLVLAGASVLRLQRHPDALAEDLRHPVRHAFVAAVPVAGLLLTTLAVALGARGPWLGGLWWLAALGQFWSTLWVMRRWLATSAPPAQGAQPTPFWPQVTPVLFIPVVGNVLVPLAGVPLGHDTWAMAQFGVGALLWPVVLTLLLVRRATQGGLPDRLLPTWFITIAPPSVIGLVAVHLQAPAALASALWGVAVFFLLWAGGVVRPVAAQAFSLTFWAVSFPLAACASLTLKLASVAGSAGLQVAGMLMLALASLVVFGLGLATVRGLRDGSLLAPEPVAQIVPASV